MSKLSQFLGSGGGGRDGSGVWGLPVIIANEGLVAEVNTSIGINTLAGEVTVTLPESPDMGDRVVFFDVAASWGITPATIKLNGDTVQFFEGESDEFKLLGKSSLLHLIFLGEVGWVDVTYLETHSIPLWSGMQEFSFLDLGAINNVTGGPQRVFFPTTSSDYVIPATGLYSLILSGGQGGKAGVNNSTFGTGGSSFLMINEQEVIRAYGSPGIGYTTPTGGPFMEYRLGVEHTQLVPVMNSDLSFSTLSMTTGVRTTYPLGVYGAESVGIDTSPYNARSSPASYPIPYTMNTWLDEGDVISIVIGAGGTAAGTSHVRGSAGKAAIYLIGDLDDL